MALVRSDPFRDVDRLLNQLWAGEQRGPRSMAMPMDAYRKQDSFVLQLDLPGVDPDSVDLTVEDDVLTIKAERPVPPQTDRTEPVIAERPFGTFARQVLLGGNLDTEHVHADYERGVLTVVLPVAERAKPRRIEVKTQANATEAVPENQMPSAAEKHTGGLLHRHKEQARTTKA